MRQATDILDSPANMQVRQLWVLQTMAKSANSKVIFVPMQLQSDVVWCCNWWAQVQVVKSPQAIQELVVRPGWG